MMERWEMESEHLHALYLNIPAVGSHHNVKFAWFEESLALHVVITEALLVELDGYGLAFAFLQEYPFKSLEFFYRSGIAAGNVVNVALYHLISIIVACIGNLDGSLYASSIDLDVHRSVVELCV